jgi:hypothetical protein
VVAWFYEFHSPTRAFRILARFESHFGGLRLGSCNFINKVMSKLGLTPTDDSSSVAPTASLTQLQSNHQRLPKSIMMGDVATCV